MGDFRVRQISGNLDRDKMYRSALRDIEAFEGMLADGAFITDPICIGAEQELCVVDQEYNPTKSALQLLDLTGDDHFTNELGLYNLEINLDPHQLAGRAFNQVEEDLLALMKKGQVSADSLGHRLFMTGILPTLKSRHLSFDYMTPVPRYQTLSQALHDIRGGAFEIYLQGVDDLIASLGSVLFEACNTSFQLHLQIDPAKFVEQYNWAQMISGPVLSACVNSPLLFGRELWSETRIALFKQSLDTRSSKNHLRKKIPRVYFGNRWLQESPAQLWKNELMRFPLIVTSDDFQDPFAQLQQGNTPDLRAIRLHTGTAYTWNRLCYGTGVKPHLRIECRYLPAGPSIRDEIANFAFWVGLMNAMPDDWANQVKSLSFRETKDNFIKAARNGLHSGQSWFGKSIPAQNLILDTLLPMAQVGLQKCNIGDKDINTYLDVIINRVQSMQTGAEWMTKSFRNLIQFEKPNSISQKLIAQSLAYQKENKPVSDWDPIERRTQVPIQFDLQRTTVGHIMSTDVFTVSKNASIEFARKIMEWNNIHHLPVEDEEGDLAGLLAADDIEQWSKTNAPQRFVHELMSTNVPSVDESLTLDRLADALGDEKGISVTYNKKIVGIVTTNDLKPYLASSTNG